MTNGVRTSTWCNCGVGGSNSADWSPTASNPAKYIGGVNYFTWMEGQLAAYEATIGRTVGWFQIMHETNDGIFTPSQSQANMQVLVNALAALRPSAKIIVHYAPYDHEADFATYLPNTENNQLPGFEGATDALVAANPGLVYAGCKDTFRYTAFNPAWRDTTDVPQPQNLIHYSPIAGRQAIGAAWAQAFAAVLFPTGSGSGSGSIFQPSIFLGGR